MKKYCVLLLLFVFGVSGCALTIEEQNRLKARKERQSNIMKSWMGSHVSEVIRSWGPPKEVTTDGAGGKIYIWKWGGKITITRKCPCQETDTKSENTDYYTEVVTAEPEYNRVRMFWANPKGIIYHWRWRGYY